MASRDIADLHPAMRPLALAAVAGWREYGLDVLIYCTFRSLEEQAKLYARGRTAPGPRVTNAQPGQSAHNYGLALDAVPLVGGKPEWRSTGAAADLWKRYGKAAKAAGLEWAGDWTRFIEYPHVQLPNWRAYVQ